MIELDQLAENYQELKNFCDIESVSDVYQNTDKNLLIERIRSIDNNAEQERKILYCVAMFRLYAILGFKSLKALLESDYITSKCPQECYKQINRAKFELMIHEGDFESVGRMPSSHLDMFSLIPVDSKTSSELTARVKSVYNDLYVEKSKGDSVTASLVKEYILDKFQQRRDLKRSSTRTQKDDEASISTESTVDWEDDELDSSADNNRDKDILISESSHTLNSSSTHSLESLVIDKDNFPALLRHLSSSLDSDEKIRLAYFLNESLLDAGDASFNLLIKEQKISKSAFIHSFKRMKYYQKKVFI